MILCNLGFSKSSINEISSLPTEIWSLVKLYQFYQDVYVSRIMVVWPSNTLGRWLYVYYSYKFAPHLFDQNIVYSQMAHFAHNRVLSTSSSSEALNIKFTKIYSNLTCDKSPITFQKVCCVLNYPFSHVVPSWRLLMFLTDPWKSGTLTCEKSRTTWVPPITLNQMHPHCCLLWKSPIWLFVTLLNLSDSSLEVLSASDWFHKVPCPFLVFKQLSGQSSTLFLFTIVDKILQTMLVVTTAAVQHFRTWWLNLMWAVSEC